MTMKIEVLPIGPYEENSIILHDGGHVLIIDPGGYSGLISSRIGRDEKVDGILLTHGHDDHTGAVDDLCEKYECDVYIHPADDAMIRLKGSAMDGGSSRVVYAETSPLEDGDMVIGAFSLHVYHTPGHSPGSVCIRYRNALITGDTLFARSIGRMDLFGGNEDEMRRSLLRLWDLEDDLKVYPGHGPSTTIGHEKQVNYYFRRAKNGQPL